MDLIEAPTAVLDPEPSTTADALPSEIRDSKSDTPCSAPDPAPAPPHVGPPTSRVEEFLADHALLDPLLDDYLDGHLKLHHLAATHKLTVVDLMAILDSPQVTQILDDLTRHAELQAHRLAILARPQAVEKLKDLAETDPSDQRLLPLTLLIRSRETTRKAAALLERISKPPKPTGARVPPVGGGSAEPPGASRAIDGAPTECAPAVLAVPSPDSSSSLPTRSPPTPDELADQSERRSREGARAAG